MSRESAAHRSSGEMALKIVPHLDSYPEGRKAGSKVPADKRKAKARAKRKAAKR